MIAIGVPFFAIGALFFLGPAIIVPQIKQTPYAAWWFGVFYLFFWLADTLGMLVQCCSYECM